MEALIVLVFVTLLPIGLTALVVGSRGRSLHYLWWPLFFSWLGMLCTIAVVLIQPEKRRP